MTTDNDVLKAYCELCRKAGSTREVGPELYKWCAELSDAETEAILVDLVMANAETINKMVFAEPQMASDQDIVDLMETMLNLLFNGFIVIRPDGELGYCSPLGPDPTESEEAAMDHRIRSAFPLVRKVVLKAVSLAEGQPIPEEPESERWRK